MKPMIKTKLKKLLKNKTILVTGGAGSIGSEVTKKGPRKILIFGPVLSTKIFFT